MAQTKGPLTIDTIVCLLTWLCRKLTKDEIIIAIAILQDVVSDKRDDIRPRNDFQENHPHYRQFTVDPKSPLIEAPLLKAPEAVADYRLLLLEYRRKTGKELKAVRRHKDSHHPRPGTRCEHCKAPTQFLYVNDGKKATQLRCKICKRLFPSHRCRKQSHTKYWCPYCHYALYCWKHDLTRTIYKCPNDRCPCYQKNFDHLNDREKVLQKTGMSSQFKLRYQYREYHYSPADLHPVHPNCTSINLNRIHNHLSTVGLVLAYSVSFGISSRMTAQILRRIHTIKLSHQTVHNYQQAAAVLAWNFIQTHSKPGADHHLAGDETYIRVNDQWHYTWFVIGSGSRAIHAFNISDSRDVLGALATLNSAIKNRPNDVNDPIEFIADGNPSYDAAVHAINADKEGKPITRRKVIGLKNEDDESQQYRAFKQLIERLNRTYKFHTRARCGFKNTNGAVALTTLFVAYYNFLRPHSSLNDKTPIHLPELKTPDTLQGQWLKMLQMAA